MSTVIVAPHPDDEWIGCGCTLLKKLDDGEKITVLLITHSSRIPTSRIKDRTKISQSLAKEYGYELKILGETELHINEGQLKSFLLNEINSGDVVYIPDFDTHPDHRFINRVCKEHLEKDLIEYAVYNNSIFPPRRIMNKTLHLLHRQSFPSFRLGTHEFKTLYKLPIKQKNIKMFGEVLRHADVLRTAKKLL